MMEVKTLLSRTIPKKIAIAMDLDDQLKNIVGDRSQIHHALMNICINAVDSMQSQGTLTIETRNDPPTDLGNSVFPNLDPGGYVAIKVHDTGIGMDQETQEKVFEPFFTTKPKGEGTGLGLSMVYGVINNHGGIVSTDSEPGKGTTVAVFLPATKQDHQPSTPGVEQRPSYSPKDERILVVDDEDIIRQSSRRLLEKLGYQVLTARNGEIASQIYKEKMDEISLVLLDIIMPVMDGAETFLSLQRMNPDVKVLLFSGFSSDEKVDMLLDKGAVGFLPKPFDLNTLSRVISKALN
jgi:CheY-like chemotaxis protein